MGRSPHLQPISSVFIFIRGIFVKPTIPDHKPSLLFWRVRHQGFSICHRRQYRSCSSESLNPGKEILGLTYSCIPYEPQYTEWSDFSFCAIWNEIIECLNLFFFFISQCRFSGFFVFRNMQALRGSIRLVRRQSISNLSSVDSKSNGSRFPSAKFHGSSIGSSKACFSKFSYRPAVSYVSFWLFFFCSSLCAH